jgi:hypothetical protein
VGALLFAAFVFFVFAKAAVARSGAQSAADAAALAAAQEVRVELIEGLVDSVDDKDGSWTAWLAGNGANGTGANAAAALAADNDSTASGVTVGVVDGNTSFEVPVTTNYAVTSGLVPIGNGQAHARAKSVIDPLCEPAPGIDPLAVVAFVCGGETFTFDPADFEPDDLPDAAVLFSVHLAE